MKRTVQGEQLFRAAEVRSQTINEEQRTIDVIFTTGYKGRRSSWFSGTYNEELEVTEQACDLTALNAGAPVLKNHDQNWEGLDAVIGVVERAWIENGVGYATLRFDDRVEADAVWQMIRKGIVRNVSVGYQVQQYQDVTQSDDKIKTYRAVKWTPREISPVPIGFDPGAQVRSADKVLTNEIEIIESRSLSESNQQGEESMTTKNEKPVEGSPEQRGAGEQTQVDLDAVKREAADAERKRGVDIRAAVRAAKLDDKFADELVSKGTSVDEARKLVLDKLADKDEATETRGQTRVVAGDLDEIVTKREAIANALQHRHDAKVELSEPARQYRGMSLLRIAEEIVGRDARGMSKSELAVRALSTSDFPIILANVARKTLRAGYTVAPQTFRAFTTQGTLPDYKQMKRIQFGAAPSLKSVNEQGEYELGTIGEGAETIQLAKYGKIIAITEETIVNDDLGAFTRVPFMMGAAAGRLESKLVYDLLIANAAMADGVALFHASHGNLGSASAINEAGLTAAKAAMRKQKDLDSEDFLDLTPAILICGPDKEVEARKMLVAVTAAKSGDVNVFQNTMDLVVDARVIGNKWFLSAAPSQIDTIEVAYLEGMAGPEITSKEHFESDGVSIKVKHVVGVKAIDHRGLFYNPGA